MKADLIINKNYTIGEIDKRLYGSFIEHLGRAVYGGIYEPGHETADEEGFRKDVIDMVKQLDVPIVRYPGGNFVSGYNWEDGIGERSKRPKKMDAAWKSIETNEVGIDEFVEWAKRANTEVMMAVNLGTRGAAEARDCLEYCNSDADSYYANLRRENGHEEPYGIKVWCLGNEMDGPWQICHKTADEYGRLAAETAKLLKLTDPNAEFVVCGSSYIEMPTFVSWEETVLDHTYEYVDYLSIHSYYANNGDTAKFLGDSRKMDYFIKTIAAVCDTVKAKKRSKKDIALSFDEWNVWYHNDDEDGNWGTGKHLLENIYTFEDALVVGCLMMTLQNNCDRVKMACLAQLVNVIAPIMTRNGGKAWAQTIFYPFLYGSANGRGTAMKPVIRCDSYEADEIGTVPYLETSVIHNPEKRTITVFAVNRSLDEEMNLSLSLEGFEGCEAVSHTELYCDDLKAVNREDDEKVVPKEVAVSPVNGNEHTAVLKKHSWNMLTYKY